MSEAALQKIQKDCAKLETELEIYKKSQPISTSCEAIISYINSQPESFLAGRTEANPWHQNQGGGGGCVIS